jgi:hypothetical protein
MLYPMQTDGPGVYDIGNVRLVGKVLYGFHTVDEWAEGHWAVVGARIS